MYYPFDSRNPMYKSKFGAVASGENLKLRLLLHADARVHDAFFCLKKDGQTALRIKMKPAEWLDSYRFYDVEYSPEVGLYFYCFAYTSDYGEFYVTAFEHNIGYVSSEGKWWQLTCYDKNYTTPDWIKGGIIYQIFPDRFYNSGKQKSGVPSDRYITANWGKQPEYRQNNGLCSLSNDYYGGDLAGITEKLPYLASLGVSCIYLNPIFEAHSNHRYNTADYKKIDPLLGDEKDLEELCKKAEEYNIGIVLDGVFSHTGDDSIYFNKYGRYGKGGAYQDPDSPYKNWFKFKCWPTDYHSWWGITTLPETVEENSEFDEFITGPDGVIRYWMKKGVKGWRLDVADELPDSILDNIRTAIKEENSDGFLLGEVWEDATNKISYGARRRYLLGRQLDSVMNYPFANAVIDYVSGGDGKDFIDRISDILEDYPIETTNVLMNHLGTHDTARLITKLGSKDYPSSRQEQAAKKLSDEEYALAVKKQKLAAVIQYTLPGIPSLYYGDEAGLEGYGDPFCRGSYPWGKENLELLDFYKWLGKMRRENDIFTDGVFYPVVGGLGSMAFMRKKDNEEFLVAVNRWQETDWITVPFEFDDGEVIHGNRPKNGYLELPPYSFALIKVKK
ncbi:MAG: glycoside hydrolase family 13 protein [Acutalibacteraceae bacterium]|nr:glycoside hydrolase family 13 protein [Acutalibacteraceae bacterium]